jgi:hypothetical protein
MPVFAASAAKPSLHRRFSFMSWQSGKGRSNSVSKDEAKGKKRKVIDLDRFEAVRGKADIKWRTDELMAVLRGDPGIKSRFRGDSS